MTGKTPFFEAQVETGRDRNGIRFEQPPSFVLPVALAVAALIAHYGTLDNYFLGDDYTMIAVNYARGLRAELTLLASDEIGGQWHEQFVRPVRSWSLRLDYAIAGLDPRIYHVSDIAAHAAASIGIALLVLSLGGEVLPAFCAALLFLLHPMNVEVVAWNTARDESLSAAALLFALLLHIRSGHSRWPKTLAMVSWLLFAVSVFTKEYAVLFPLALLGLGWVSGKSLRDVWLRVVPYVVIVAIFIGVRWVAFASPVGGYGSGHAYLRTDLFVSSVRGFFAGLLGPATRHPWALMLLLAGALPQVLDRPRTRTPSWKQIAYWGIFWFGLFLLPTHNLVFSARHLYLSFAGLAVAVGLALSRRRTRWHVVFSALATAGLALVLLPQTLASERTYARKALECQNVIAELESATSTTPDGSILVLVGVPQHHEPPWGFGWSLADALGPPFLPAKLDERFRIIVRRGWRETAWSNYRDKFPDSRLRVLRWRPDSMVMERVIAPDERAPGPGEIHSSVENQ